MQIIVGMKITSKVIIAILVSACLGLILPLGLALLDVLPFLNGATPYESVLTYMLFSGMLGALIGVTLVYRMTTKTSAAK